MKYLPLGFSILSFIVAGMIALTTSAHAGLFFGGEDNDCEFTSNQSCVFALGPGPVSVAALR